MKHVLDQGLIGIKSNPIGGLHGNILLSLSQVVVEAIEANISSAPKISSPSHNAIKKSPWRFCNDRGANMAS